MSSQKVEYFPAQDNDAFHPMVTALIRFARCSEKTECEVCKVKTKKMWTMLVPFKAGLKNNFSMDFGDDLSPLALVCEDHPLNPCFISLMSHCDAVPDEDQ